MKPTINDLIQEIETAQNKKLIEAKFLHSIICLTFPAPLSNLEIERQLKKAKAMQDYITKTYFDVTKIYCYTREYPRLVEMFICHEV